MSVNTLTLTAGGNAGQAGYTSADEAGQAFWSAVAPCGTLSSTTIDGNSIGVLAYSHASLGNSTVNIEVQYTGTPPLDNYITSITFTGDTGSYVLDQSAGLTTSLVTGTANTYKRYAWNGLSVSFPSQFSPFTVGNPYTITVTTNPAAAGTPIPDVTGLLLADATAAIVGGGFVLGTVTGSNNASFAPGQIISQSPTGGTVDPAGTVVNLTECFGPFNLTAKFVPAVDFKAIMVANPGYINPRVYEPVVDTTVRITK